MHPETTKPRIYSKMSATLSRQDSEEVKVIVRCIARGYRECFFNVNILEVFEVKSNIGEKGKTFKLWNNIGELGHLQRELEAPLWLLKRPLSDSKCYVNLLLYITLVSPKVLTEYLKFQISPESSPGIFSVHLIVAYLTPLLQENHSMIQKFDGEKAEELKCQLLWKSCFLQMKPRNLTPKSEPLVYVVN